MVKQAGFERAIIPKLLRGASSLRSQFSLAAAGSALLTGVTAFGACAQPLPVPQAEGGSVNPALYFLSIGAEDYAGNDGSGLPRVDGAVNSASKIAELAQQKGARYGVLLTSRPNSYVTRADVFTALTQIKAKIWHDRPYHPVILFYYAGHGIGDSSYLNLFLPPGDIVLSSGVSQSARNNEMRSLIWSDDILVKLQFMSVWLSTWDASVPSDLITSGDSSRLVKALGLDVVKSFVSGTRHLPTANGDPSTVPFVAIFDNCFNGVAHDLVDEVGRESSNNLQAAISEFVTSFSVLGREMLNQQLRGLLEDGLVIYAAPPGGEVAMVSDPTVEIEGGNPASYAPVGPLAGRLLAAVRSHSNVITFGDLVRIAKSVAPPTKMRGSDDAQVASYIFNGNNFEDDTVLLASSPLPQPTPLGALDKWSGSGVTVSFCCGADTAERQRVSDSTGSFTLRNGLAYYRNTLTEPAITWVSEAFRVFLGPGGRCAAGYALRFSTSGSVEIDECEHGRKIIRSTTWSLRANGSLDPLLSYDGSTFELRIDARGREHFLHLLKKGSVPTEASSDQEFRQVRD